MAVSPSNRDLLAVVRAWVATNYPGCPLEYVEIHCRYLSHPIALADGPASPVGITEVVAGERDERADDDGIPLCVKEILQTLREVGQPLTLTLLKQEMAKRHFNWHERTLKRHLSELMEEGTIENPKGARPPGYRLIVGDLPDEDE